MERWAELTVFPETLECFTRFSFFESSKTIYLSLVPLTIVLISILVHYLASSVFLAINKIAIVFVSIFYYLQTRSVSLEFSWLVETNIAEKELFIVVPDGCFSDMGQKGEYCTILIFFYCKFVCCMEVGNELIENWLSKSYKFLFGTIFVNIWFEHFLLKISFSWI